MQARSSRRVFHALLSLGLSLLLVGVFALMTGCSSSQEPSRSEAQNSSQAAAKRSSDKPLQVGVQYNALSVPAAFANEYGYFSDAGLNVEVHTFANGADENRALESGDIEIASDGVASVYMLATGKFSWIGESDDSSTTAAVYIREGSAPTFITGAAPNNPTTKGSPDTLHGLTVVGPAGTMEEWVATSYFSQFGLVSGVDYEYVEMDRPQAADCVIDGKADIFIATDADYCRIMEEAGFVPLAIGTEATLTPFINGYLVNNEVLEDRYDDVVKFLQAVYRAAETLNNDPDLRSSFAYEYYRANGKPTTRADVTREMAVRTYLVPSDFEAPDYRLGAGVLDVGWFDASIGALEDSQMIAIENSLNTKVLEDAFGIEVQADMLSDALQSAPQ